MATATFYSTPGTATSGYVQRQAAETWATIRSATDGTSYGDDNGTDTFALIQAFNIGGSYRLTRGFILFDTSSLGSGATINSATLSLYGDTISTDVDTDGGSVNIFSSTPASNTALELADYDQIGSTSFSTAINIGSWTRGGYNDFALNASGLADINKTGISKFSIRTSFDSANSAPSGNNVVWMSLGNTSGTTQDPKLVVDYTITSTHRLLMMGVGI